MIVEPDNTTIGGMSLTRSVLKQGKLFRRFNLIVLLTSPGGSKINHDACREKLLEVLGVIVLALN